MTSAVALLLGMSANAQIKVTSDEVEVLNPLRIGVHSIQREGSQYLRCEVEHSGGNTLLTTYYFYVKSTRFGQAINRWYPMDPTEGSKFLVRKKRESTLNLSNVIQSGEQYEAAATREINLLPGFEVKQGGSFATDIGPDVNEEEIFNCQ